MHNLLKTISICTILSSTILTLPGCSAKTDNNPESSKAQSVQEYSPDTVQFFDGSQKVKSSSGRTWTPPAGSHTDKNGSVIDKNGCVIGQVGPVHYDPNAVG